MNTDKEKKFDIKRIFNNLIFLLFAGLTIAAVIGFIWAFKIHWNFNYAPYATGPYGSNVIHPTNPTKKWIFICPILSCIFCSIATAFKENN